MSPEKSERSTNVALLSKCLRMKMFSLNRHHNIFHCVSLIYPIFHFFLSPPNLFYIKTFDTRFLPSEVQQHLRDSQSNREFFLRNRGSCCDRNVSLSTIPMRTVELSPAIADCASKYLFGLRRSDNSRLIRAETSTAGQNRSAYPDRVFFVVNLCFGVVLLADVSVGLSV